VGQCLRETHEALSGLLHHEHASLALAQRCSALPGGTPLFSALFNYRHAGATGIDRASKAWQGMEVLGGEGRTNFPFGMSVDDLGDGFMLVAYIVKSLDAERVCGYMHEAVLNLVDALAQDPDRQASSLAVMSAAERTRLMRWGVNDRVHPDLVPVHRLFE
jgi:hypothetical protein